ncbi:RHS repeat domain-containing protein [Brumimicrobium aurantiacum]|nr:RHS repeat-associated core domain-containing protein [Brumimicrobium aurantiacum]
MPGRKFQPEDYRYGFQGQEKDDEIKGPGNSVNYKYRMHDPRVGRFFAVDPLAAEYPHNSPYAFSENSTIAFVELEGLERIYYLWGHDEKGELKKIFWKTVLGYTTEGGEFKTYEEEFILRRYDGPFSKDWLFTDREEFIEFDGGYFDVLWHPSDGLIRSEIIDAHADAAGTQGERYKIAEGILEILDRREWRSYKLRHKASVIVADFQSKESAIEYSKELLSKFSKDGFELSVIPTEDGYSVSTGSFDIGSMQEAVDQRNELRGEGYVRTEVKVIETEVLQKAEKVKL